MATLKPKRGQTPIDLVNNMYASLDYVSKVYKDNPSFNINDEYTDVLNYELITTQDVNNIVNNNYVFMNKIEKIYDDILTITYTSHLFNTDLGISLYDIIQEADILPSYKYKLVETNEENIMAFGSNYNVNILEVTNEVIISIEKQSVNSETVINNINFNSAPIISIKAGKFNVGDNFVMNLSNLYFLNDFSFITNIKYIGIGGVTLDLSGTLQTTQRCNNFINILQSSSIGNADGESTLIISSNDIVPSGAVWTALETQGWSLSIV